MNRSSSVNQPSIKNFHFTLNTDFKVFFLEIRMMYQMPREVIPLSGISRESMTVLFSISKMMKLTNVKR